EALRALQAEGKLPADYAVPCQIVSDDHALEMSLAENTVRLAMHPADQFEAFAGLIDQGMSAAQVAQRFGVEESLVLKRLKLARFIGLDAYAAAGGSTRADLFGDEVYLEKPALLHKLVEQKLSAIRQELEAEGWGWIEINPERDYSAISRCDRIKPRLIDAPA